MATIHLKKSSRSGTAPTESKKRTRTVRRRRRIVRPVTKGVGIGPTLLYYFSLAIIVAGVWLITLLPPSMIAGNPAGMQLVPYDSANASDAHIATTLDDDGCEEYLWDMENFQPTNPSEFATGRVNFAVNVAGEEIVYPLMSIMVMPGEGVEVKGVEKEGNRDLRAMIRDGRLDTIGRERWYWRAPKEPGMYCVRVEDRMTKEAICINAFVLRPYNGAEYLNGYHIGQYQTQPLNNDPNYIRPRGMIEVTPEIEDAWVSPHFQLRQFVCKQESSYPKYMVLRTRLLRKLEGLLEDLNTRGIPATSFYVVSGYRTPWYNEQLGNETIYSRHMYGDAADFLVDINRDGLFDDVDRNGGVNTGDVLYVRSVVDQMEYRRRELIGGFGVYEPIPGTRGPFVHMDTRGNPARWVVTPGEEEDQDSLEAVSEEDSTLVEEAEAAGKDTVAATGRPSREKPEPKKPGTEPSEEVMLPGREQLMKAPVDSGKKPNGGSRSGPSGSGASGSGGAATSDTGGGGGE